MASATFYPDAHPEASSVDGCAFHNDAGNRSWDFIHDAAGTGADDAGVQSIMVLLVERPANYWAQIRRAPLLFDTSPLPPDAIPISATLSIYGTAKDDDIGINPSINIYSSNPASNTAVVAGDYVHTRWGTTPLATAITYANWKTADPFWNDFILNAAGIALINKTGVSKFGLRIVCDATDTEPALSGGDNIRSSFSFYQADQGEGFEPKLVIIYIVGAPRSHGYIFG